MKWTILLFVGFFSLIVNHTISVAIVFDNDCPQDLEISLGASWRGIRIGESSLFDIEEIFGIRFAFVVSLASEKINRNNYYLHLLDDRAYREGLPTYIEVCIINGSLASIRLTPDADHETPSSFLHDWIQVYGIPEFVTWDATGNSWRWREVAWPEKGIILTVDTSLTTYDPVLALVNTVTFAPFINDSNPLDFWPILPYLLNHQHRQLEDIHQISFLLILKGC